MASMPVAKKWLWIGLATLAVVALVVAAVLTADEGDGPAVPGTAETTTTARSQSVTPSGAPAPGSPADTAASGSTGTKPGTTAPRVTPPTKPVDDGAELTTVTTPPAHTLAMIERENATANSTYDVVFQVYGFGPGGGSIASLVVSITSSKPAPGTEKPFDLNKRNALCRMSASDAEAVALGGTYRGVITLKPSGDVLVLWLSDVTAEK